MKPLTDLSFIVHNKQFFLVYIISLLGLLEI